MKISRIVPWLVRSSASYWGEFLFVEVRTDEGLSGWGEITTTTRAANRATGALLHQLNDLLVGEDAARIEALWHKTFRSFTYSGSRGLACTVVSAIDIALWDLRGKALDQPVYELLGGPVREDLLLYTHPTRAASSTRTAWSPRSAASSTPAHRDQVRPVPARGRPARRQRRLPRRPAGPGRRAGCPGADRADPRGGRARRRAAGRRARPLRRPDRDPAGERPRRHHRRPLVRGARAAGEPGRPAPGARARAPPDLGRGTAAHPVGLRSGAQRAAHRLRHARRDLDRRHQRAEEDRHHGRGLVRAGLPARRQRPGQPRRRRPRHGHHAELLPAGVQRHRPQPLRGFLDAPLENTGGRLRLPTRPGLGLGFDTERMRAHLAHDFGS